MATRTIKQSGGDFSTLAAALADAATAAGDTLEISGSWSVDDTAVCTVADNTITIQAVGSSKCAPGSLDSPTHYRLRCATGGSHCILVNNGPLVIDGLEIKQASTTASDEGIRVRAVTATIKNSVIWTGAYTLQQDGIYCYETGSVINVENCIIFGFDRAGVHLQNWTGTVTMTVNANSSTIYKCGNDTISSTEAPGGIGLVRALSESVLTANVFNCIVVGNTANGDDFSEGEDIQSTWNIHNSIDSDNSIAAKDPAPYEALASRTATDSDSPGAGAWVVFQDVTGDAPWDLRLKTNAENDAQDAHARTSGAGLDIPSADIIGTSRPQNTNYDIGAFEYVAAGGSTYQETATDGFKGAETLARILTAIESASDGVKASDAAITALLAQHSFRFRNDDESEAAATWKAALNTDLSLAAGNTFRLRYLINALSDPASKQFQVEYRRKPSGGAFGDWKKIN